MKQLKFTLITNGKIVIDKFLNYYLKDNILRFKDEDTYYEYDINNITLIKKDNESSIKINFPKKIITISLLSINQSYDMEIDNISTKTSDQEINLEYTFDNDEKTTNCITIRY